jgi:hypothetical protein
VARPQINADLQFADPFDVDWFPALSVQAIAGHCRRQRLNLRVGDLFQSFDRRR